MRTPRSLDDFLVVEMLINEGSYPAASDGQVESEDSAAFRPQENTIVLGQRRAFLMFTSCIVVQPASDRRHSVQFYFGAFPNILYLEL